MSTGLHGYKGKIHISVGTLTEFTEWSYSGPTMDFVEKTAFEDTYKLYDNGQVDGGQVTARGYYDNSTAAPSCGNCIATLIKCCIGGTAISSPQFYYSASGYFAPTTGASVFVESVDGPNVNINGMAEIGFTMRISGGYLEKSA